MKEKRKIIAEAYFACAMSRMEICMCGRKIRVIIGTASLCFSGGILVAYVLPGFVIAFIESAVLLAAGIMLIKK